jgi:hypothetical protein
VLVLTCTLIKKLVKTLGAILFLAYSSGLKLCVQCTYLSHYIEVAQEAIFMKQNMRFVLVLGPLAIMKINCTVKYFSGFMFFGQKFKYCSVRTKKLHKMKVRKPKEKYSQSIMSCSTRDTSLRKFFTMTFVHTHHYFFKTFFPGILVLLKVRKSQNDFFKTMFPPKKTRQILLYYYESSVD